MCSEKPCPLRLVCSSRTGCRVCSVLFEEKAGGLSWRTSPLESVQRWRKAVSGHLQPYLVLDLIRNKDFFSSHTWNNSSGMYHEKVYASSNYLLHCLVKEMSLSTDKDWLTAGLFVSNPVDFMSCTHFYIINWWFSRVRAIWQACMWWLIFIVTFFPFINLV